jgi:putative transposase
MGRQLRIFYSGYAYHVIARGNERKNIFRDDGDRKKFLAIVKEAKEKFEVIVIAYVLMSNHYHLIIEIKKPNLSQAMQYINASYSVFFNWKHKRNGHLFQGRS